MRHDRHSARLASLVLLAAAQAHCASSVTGSEPSPAADAGPADVAVDARADGSVTVVPGPPRLVAPLSTSEVTSHRPTLRWELGRDSRAARVRVCADRELTRACQSVDVEGTAVRVPLAQGVWYWRASALDANGAAGAGSFVWQLRVGPRDSEADTSRPGPLDANADGYADHLVVASPRPQREANEVAVHFGSASGITAPPSATLERRWGDDESPAPWRAGDVDGDGYADVIVSSVSPVRVYRGSAAGLAPAYELRDAIADGYFVAAGDLNGDGYADLVATEARGRGAAAVVYFGGASGPSATRTIASAMERNLAPTVAAGGDVNGDGYADLLVVRGGTAGGDVRLYLGAADGPVESFSTLSNDAIDDDDGQFVDGTGDLNGDGYSDVVRVNSYSRTPALSFATTALSRTRVYLGGPLGLGSTPALTLEASALAGAPGGPVVTLNYARPDASNDLNGDGCDDAVFVASPGGDGGGLLVLFGAPSLAGRAMVALPAPSGDELVVGDFAGGDANGDGFDDLLLGSVATAGGVVYAYDGSASGPRAPSGGFIAGAASAQRPYVSVQFAR